MADKIILPSKADWDLIRQMADWWRRQTPPGTPYIPEELGQSPDVYIARSPPSGIPGLVEETGTGVGQENDIPGSAVCDIYKISHSEDRLYEVEGFTKTVRNISISTIAGNTWVLVVRDKFGDWFAVVGGSGTKRGKLDDILSYQGNATMSVWAWNGSAEADTTENITVYDWLLSSGQTVASGKQVTAAWDEASGRYYLIGAQCV